MNHKQEILDLVILFLKREEEVLMAATRAANEAATESEAKPENQYDTRGLEQSYLAVGQAKRTLEIKNIIQNFKSITLHLFDSSSPIDLSALVDLQNEEGEIRTYFILPSRGGIKVKYQDKEIATLSPESSLGRSLLGKVSGESIETVINGQAKSYLIVSIC